MIDKAKVARTVRRTVELLVQKQYDTISKLGKQGSLNANLIEFGVSQYPGKLIAPPNDAYSDAYVYEADEAGDDGFVCSIEFPLWTEEEGRSDLFLLLSLYEDDSDFYAFTFDDLDVP
jgi:hypothetical protein